MHSTINFLGVKKYIFGVFIILLLSSCGKIPTTNEVTQTQTAEAEIVTETTQEPQEKVLVATSIVPISSLVHSIGGNFVEVENIVPAGVSPHGFDLSAKQMAEITKSEKVFMIGLEHIDGFLEKAVAQGKQIHLADGMELIEVKGHEHHDEHGEESHDEDEHEDEHHDEHDSHEDEHHDDDTHEEEHHDEHNHSSDPHVWLGKDNIIEIAQDIRDELTKILPEQEQYFSENTQKFIAEIETLYSDFAAETKGKKPKEFIVFHDAYNYLMQSIGMDMNLKVPFSENVLHETGTAHLAELVQEIQLHGITHAFSEPQFSLGNLQKLANEYNLTIGTLDPLGQNSLAGWYLENLKSNLDNLSKIYE